MENHTHLGWRALIGNRMAAMRLDLIGRYLRPHRKTVIFGAIALVVVNVLSVTIPMEVRRVIDELQVGFAYDRVLSQAAWIVLLATTMGAVRLLSRQLVFGVGRQVEVELRQSLFDHMLRQEPAWVQTTGSGDVINRATSDVENIRRLLGFAILSLTNTLLAYSLTLPAMLTIDPSLTLAAIGPYPVMLTVVRLFGGRMMKQQRRQQEDLSGLSDLIQEDLSGIGAIKITARKHRSSRRFPSATAVTETVPSVWHGLEAPSSPFWRVFPPSPCCCCWPWAAASSVTAASRPAGLSPWSSMCSSWFFPQHCWASRSTRSRPVR